MSDIRDKVSTPPGRIRREGGGRKRKTTEDPTLVADLKSPLGKDDIRLVDFVDRIPKSPSGKILRRLLRDGP